MHWEHHLERKTPPPPPMAMESDVQFNGKKEFLKETAFRYPDGKQPARWVFSHKIQRASYSDGPRGSVISLPCSRLTTSTWCWFSKHRKSKNKGVLKPCDKDPESCWGQARPDSFQGGCEMPSLEAMNIKWKLQWGLGGRRHQKCGILAMEIWRLLKLVQERGWTCHRWKSETGGTIEAYW